MKTITSLAHERARRVGTTRFRAFQRMALGGSFAVLMSLGAFSQPALVRADEPPAATATAALPPDEVERQAEAIARSIMSPFCPGRTVSACPVAGPWRDDIRKWVGEGVDPLEIKRRLSERVPEHNLAGVPKNRLGWVLPVGLGVLALGVLIFLLRYLVGPRGAERTSKDLPPTGDAPPPGQAKPGSAVASRANGDDYEARLEQELETLER
jgi:cytochrome c-type biogenesis protein CcmH/NrfF